MVSGTEFVAQMQSVTTRFVGRVVASCVIQSQLKRNCVAAETCSVSDCKKLVDCTVEAIGLFTTKDETKKLKRELEALYRSNFPAK